MERRIAIFTFLNQTQKRTVVDCYDHNGAGYDFMQIFEQAKGRCFEGDEERGRGRIASFEIGAIVTLPREVKL